MFSADSAWIKVPGASAPALEELRAAVDLDLPRAYFDLLSFSDGGEGPLAVSPYNFCLHSAAEAMLAWVQGTYREFFPGFFVFGVSGGGDYIAFDFRKSEPWPVVAIDMTNIDLSESVDLVAHDFQSFLALIGAEKADA